MQNVSASATAAKNCCSVDPRPPPPPPPPPALLHLLDSRERRRKFPELFYHSKTTINGLLPYSRIKRPRTICRKKPQSLYNHNFPLSFAEKEKCPTYKKGESEVCVVASPPPPPFGFCGHHIWALLRSNMQRKEREGRHRYKKEKRLGKKRRRHTSPPIDSGSYRPFSLLFMLEGNCFLPACILAILQVH